MGPRSWEEDNILSWLKKALNETGRPAAAGGQSGGGGGGDILRPLFLRAVQLARRQIAEVRMTGFEPPCADWIQRALMAVPEAEKSYDASQGASMRTWAERKIHYALKGAKSDFFKDIAAPDTWLWRRVAYLKELFRLETYSIPSEAQLADAGLDTGPAGLVRSAVAAIKARNKRIKDGSSSIVGREIRFGTAPPFDELGREITGRGLDTLSPLACYKILKEKAMLSKDCRPLSEECVRRDTFPLEDGELRDTLAFYRILEEKSIRLRMAPTRSDLAETDVFMDVGELESFCRIRKEIATMPSAQYLAKSERIHIEVAADFLKRWVPHRSQSCGFVAGEPSEALDHHDDDTDSGLTSREVIEHPRFHSRLELHDIIDGCLERIRPEYRKLLEEHLEGATARELSERFGEPVHNIENRIRRSRAKVKKCIEYYLSDEDILVAREKIMVNIRNIKHPVHIHIFNNRVTVSHNIGDIPCVLIHAGREHISGTPDKLDNSEFFTNTFNCQMAPVKYDIHADVNTQGSSLSITLIEKT